MKEFSNTLKGMVKDLEVLSPDQYSHALNLIMESFDGNSFLPSNDYSNVFGCLFPNENILHKKYISELDKVILFTTQNRILELSIKYSDRGFNSYDSQEGSKPVELGNTPILSVKILAASDCFNWSLKNKIKSVYKITDDTLNYYFVDGFNDDRYLYFDINGSDLTVEESFKEIISYNNSIPQYSDNIDCNSLKWYPEISYPSITTSETEGGELPAGVYQFLAAYSTSKGIPLTNYKASTNPFHLFTKKITDVTNYNTGKAINVRISNLKKVGRYQYINLAVAKTIDGVTTYEQIATLPISEIINHTYTGNNTAIRLDETVIFQLYPFYQSSKGITKSNNKLFKNGVKEFEKINLQPLADRFKIKWFTTSLKLGSYYKPEIAQNYRSNIRDDVYPYGLEFITDNGEKIPPITLIGRKIEVYDLLFVNNSDVIKTKDNCNEDEIKKYWQVYNTAFVTKTDSISTDECDIKQYQEGEFAYWESTEKYPNDEEVWGSLANKPIRHPKMPDCLVSPHYSNVGGEVYIHPLGVKLDDSVNVESVLQEAVNMELITQAQKDRIKGYKIVRGNRANNKSIIAKGHLHNTYQYLENGKQTVYANYPFNDLRPDPYLSREPLKTSSVESYKDSYYNNEFIENKKYVFYSPDTSFVQPLLGTTLKVEQEHHGDAKGFFNKSRKQGEYVILSQLHYNFAIVIAWLLTERLELEKSQPGEQGGAIGSAVGAVAGGVIGAYAGAGVGAPLGAALGSALGGTIGKLIAGSNTDNDYNAMYRLTMWVSQTDRILELLQNTIPMQNYHWQYQAVGKYDKNSPVLNVGRKQREIVASSYLNSTRQLLPNEVSFNNNYRESSVYLELNDTIGTPSIKDTSRFTTSQKDCNIDEGEEVLSKVSSFYTSIKREVVNQYSTIDSIEWLSVSNKIWNLDQKFKEFGGDTFIGTHTLKIKQSMFTNTSYNLPDRTDVYYEDLNNIAYPKHFFNTKYTELDNPNEVSLKELTFINGINVIAALNNLESPKAITSNLDTAPNQTNSTVETIGRLFRESLLNPYTLTRPGRYNLDCAKDDFFNKSVIKVDGNGSPTDPNDYLFIAGDGTSSARSLLKDVLNVQGAQLIPKIVLKFIGVKGKIYTYVYGIPQFVVESDVNLDLRHAEDPNEGNFYPNITDLNYWLQEENVSPKVDNKYTYNRTYSKQNKEDVFLKYDINFSKEKNKIYHANRIIYSQDGAEVENSSIRDSYLYFKPLDSKDLTFENGKIISVDSIEDQKLLVRFENATRIYNAYSKVRADNTTLILGSGDIFDNFTQFSVTDLGYIGSQHSDILHTPFGHIYTDARRGNIFNVTPGGEKVDELSKNGMRNWFTQNLPFKISDYFTIDVDNNYNDVGLTLSYDHRFKRFFITKLDYIPKDKNIEYIDGKFYLDDNEVRLNDGRYFCNASWTISYSFYTESWSSFHSFTPNYYIDGLNIFYTGINGIGRGDSSLWVHNITNKSFQTYYNKIRPFEIESVLKYSISPKILTEVGFKLDALRYHNSNDVSYIEDVAFNKAIIYNDRQNSGLLFLDVIDRNNLFLYKQYPIKNYDGTHIILRKNETEYNFNQFEDISLNNNLPRFINSCNGVNKILNLKSIDYSKLKIDNSYIRGDKASVRFINDENNKYKLIYKGLIENYIPSIK